jgi:hypothetical protein
VTDCVFWLLTPTRSKRVTFPPYMGASSRRCVSAARRSTPADVAEKHDPPRRFVRGNIGALIEPNGRLEYLAIYGMDHSTPARRTAFLRRVTRAFRTGEGAHGGSSAASRWTVAAVSRRSTSKPAVIR